MNSSNPVRQRKSAWAAHGALLILGASLSAVPAWAQEWPTKPVRFVVPLAPGGPSDIVLRSSLEKMQAVLKQPLVVENKPGANGNLGSAEVARSAPDGYTWLWTTDTTVTVNPWVYRTMAFKPEDLVPVIRASTLSQILVCNPNLGLNSLTDFVNRAKGGKLTYASGGAGSPGHLTTERFASAAGINPIHVPYKGPAPAMQDVMGGQVDCGFLAGTTVLPQVRAGKLKALAVSGGKRSSLLPDVPTIAESGYPGFETVFSLVLFAPRGTPQAIIDRVQSTMATALRTPDLVEKLRTHDLDVVAANSADTAARLREDSKTWGELIKKIGLKED